MRLGRFETAEITAMFAALPEHEVRHARDDVSPYRPTRRVRPAVGRILLPFDFCCDLRHGAFSVLEVQHGYKRAILVFMLDLHMTITLSAELQRINISSSRAYEIAGVASKELRVSCFPTTVGMVIHDNDCVRNVCERTRTLFIDGLDSHGANFPWSVSRVQHVQPAIQCFCLVLHLPDLQQGVIDPL